MKRNAVKRLSFVMSMVVVAFGVAACCRGNIRWTAVTPVHADSTVCHLQRGSHVIVCDEYLGGQVVKKDTTGVGEG
ncbi:MAG TPA: hypothetical protein VKH19_14265 [Gemmatimonadaceae bacterium]|nr:hypothetical protein [Gemmatimonadaceae bacterium]